MPLGFLIKKNVYSELFKKLLHNIIRKKFANPNLSAILLGKEVDICSEDFAFFTPTNKL